MAMLECYCSSLYENNMGICSFVCNSLLTDYTTQQSSVILFKSGSSKPYNTHKAYTIQSFNNYSVLITLIQLIKE